MKEKVQNLRTRASLLATSMILLTPSTVFASSSDYSDVPGVSGLVSLLDTAANVLVYLCIFIAIAMQVYRGIKWFMADDHEKAHAKKTFIQGFGLAVVIILVPALVTWVLAYFS